MSETLTYERLSQALLELGFTSEPAPGYTLFRNEEHAATLVIPTVEASEQVRPVHFIAARETVVGRGVTDAATFDRLFVRYSEI